MTASAHGGVLSEAERRTLVAVCGALLPALEPRDGDSPELFRLSAEDLGIAVAVEQVLGVLSERQVRELRLFIRLLGSRPFMTLATRRTAAFADLSSSEDREAALLALATSPLPPIRSGYQALKRLATFLFYAVTRDDGANPTWKTFGYEVPRPRAAESPLRITEIREPTTFDADVCVVGSGAGGGVVAAQLAASGHSVVVLEAGPADQAGDFDQREIVGTQRLYLEQGTTATRDVGVTMLAGSCVGGGTAINWQTSLRLPDYVRDEWTDRSGLRLFSDGALTKAFDAVEKRLSVGTAESIRNGNNAPLERGCQALGYHWLDIPRNARHCDQSQCGFCVFGCRVGGKQSTANTYLLDAQAAGGLIIVAGCKAQRVTLDRGSAAGVMGIAVDDSTGRWHPVRVNARTVVIAAGGLETPALLLRSGVVHPHLGRNLHLHPTTALAGYYREPVRGWVGAPQSVLCDEFSRLRGNYGYRIEAAPIHPGLIALAHPWHGARAHRRTMQRSEHVSGLIVLSRDRNTGRVSVDAQGRTVVDYRVGRLERELLQHGIATVARIHWAAGAEEIQTFHVRDHSLVRSEASGDRAIDDYCAEIASLPVHANHCGVFSAHQMGTCRMGVDRRSAVCDERGQVFGVPGLYVADASLFPASSGVNPMLTVMALASLVGEGLASQ